MRDSERGKGAGRSIRKRKEQKKQKKKNYKIIYNKEAEESL